MSILLMLTLTVNHHFIIPEISKLGRNFYILS